MKSGLVVGNPKLKSRTYEAGELVVRALTGSEPDVAFDVVEFGSSLLSWGDATIENAISEISKCELVVFASPTYKATYTGLMKLFLDQVPPNGLGGIVAFPVMLGASPSHALACDLLFKPVLVELGAICPMRGLYLMENSYADSDELNKWAQIAIAALSLTK